MWPNPQKTTDLVTLTEEMLNEKLHFCAINSLCLAGLLANGNVICIIFSSSIVKTTLLSFVLSKRNPEIWQEEIKT